MFSLLEDEVFVVDDDAPSFAVVDDDNAVIIFVFRAVRMLVKKPIEGSWNATVGEVV